MNSKTKLWLGIAIVLGISWVAAQKPGQSNLPVTPQQESPGLEAELERQREEQRAHLKAEFAQLRDKLFAQHAALMKRGKYAEASNALVAYVDAVDDAELQSRYRNSEVAANRLSDVKEKQERKKHGVSIGMTQQDVLDSSWGRPNRVNRTTTAYGVHEQWVYPGGYLYFDKGVLSSIQN